MVVLPVHLQADTIYELKIENVELRRQINFSLLINMEMKNRNLFHSQFSILY